MSQRERGVAKSEDRQTHNQILALFPGIQIALSAFWDVVTFKVHVDIAIYETMCGL